MVTRDMRGEVRYMLKGEAYYWNGVGVCDGGGDLGEEWACLGMVNV